MWRSLLIAMLATTPVTAQDFFTLKGHGGPIMDIAVGPSDQIATASFDNSVGYWTHQGPQWLDGHNAAANTVAFWSDDILFSGGDDFTVRIWSPDGSGRPLGKHLGKVTALAQCRGPQNLLASASWDGTIGLWDLGPDVAALLEQDAAPPPNQRLKGHSSGVNDVLFSSDCTTLYSAASDGTIRLWDVASGSQKRQLVKHGFGVNTLILNETDGWLAYGAVDGGTRLIAHDTGAEIADFTLDRRPILAMAYTPVQNRMAVGDGQGYIMMIDTDALTITRDFKATLKGPIWALGFSDNGENIHAGGIENILYSWPVATLKEHGPMTGGRQSFLEDPDSLPNGERQFKRKCSICHALTAGSARKAGPSLHQIFGRKAGSLTDYSYSDTLLSAKIIWSDATIDALFDIGPDHYIPGSKMPMQRIVQQSDRDDLIEYLRKATAQEEK